MSMQTNVAASSEAVISTPNARCVNEEADTSSHQSVNHPESMAAGTEHPASVAAGSTIFYTHSSNLASGGESSLYITSLTCPQLQLRLPSMHDTAALLRIFTDHRNVQYDKSCAGLDSVDAIVNLIKQWQIVDLPLQRANIVIVVDGKTVGTGGLGWVGRRKTDGKLIGDAGLMLDTYYRGSGYGYESLRMVIDHGFAVLGMDEIHMACVDANTAFKGLMNKKFGFPAEVIKDKLFGNEWIWRITKEAWEDSTHSAQGRGRGQEKARGVTGEDSRP